MSVRATATVIACATLCASACTLLLDDLDLTCKDSDKDCAALNQNHGFGESDCEIYQCRADGRGCEKRARDRDGDGSPDEKTCAKELPGQLDCDDRDDAAVPGSGEICDGLDNNCDGFIDENQLGQATLALRDSAAVGAVIHASYSEQGDALGIALTVKTGSETDWWLAGPRLAGPSPLLVSDPCSDKGGCTFKEMAVFMNDRFTLALAVDGAHCTDGRIRVGARRNANGPFLGFRGSAEDHAPNELASGVDRDERSDCSESDEPRGARSPSLAFLPVGTESITALGLFRADSQTKPNKPASLVAIGLRTVKDENILVDGDRVTDDRVEATNGAYSEPLNTSDVLGRDAASVRAWNGMSPGYFVGYDSDRGVELAFIPALDTLQSALTGMRSMLFAAEAGVRQVALAFDPAMDSASAEPRGLAVVWRSQGAGQDAIRFARLALSSKTKAPFAKLGTILSFPASGPILDGPSVAYANSGFSARTETPGGWFVTWVESREGSEHLLGARIAEDSGEPIEDAFVLAEGTQIRHPFAYTRMSPATAPSLGYAFLSQPGPQQLNIGSLSCGSSD